MNFQFSALMRSLVIAATVTAVSLWLIWRYTWRRDSFAVLDHLDYRFLAVAAGVVLLSWAVDGLRMTMTVRAAGCPLSYFHGFRTIMLGYFLSAITPFLAGGAPLQVYSLYRAGVPSGTATAIVLTSGLIAQLMLTIASVVIAVFWPAPFEAGTGLLVTLRWALVVYSIGLACFFLMIWHVEAGAKPILSATTRLLKRFRRVDGAKLDAKVDGIIGFLQQLNESFRELVSRRPRAALAAVLGYLAYFTAYFSTAPVLLLGVGVDVPYMLQLALQIPVYLLASILPTPGGSGGLEAGMALVYSGPLPEAVLAPFVVGWRVLTYYPQIVVGGALFLGLFRHALHHGAKERWGSRSAPPVAPDPSSGNES